MSEQLLAEKDSGTKRETETEPKTESVILKYCVCIYVKKER